MQNTSPARAKRLGQGHPCLRSSLGISPAVQIPAAFDQSLCYLSFPPPLVYIFISWNCFCFLMIFNSLLSSLNKSTKSVKSIFYLFDAFLKCTLLEQMHRVAALIALPFQVGLLWIFSWRLSGTPLVGVKAAAHLATNQKALEVSLEAGCHLEFVLLLAGSARWMGKGDWIPAQSAFTTGDKHHKPQTKSPRVPRDDGIDSSALSPFPFLSLFPSLSEGLGSRLMSFLAAVWAEMGLWRWGGWRALQASTLQWADEVKRKGKSL